MLHGECLSSHMRACIKLKWVSASALTPSAGLTSRSKTLRPFPPKAGSGLSPGAKTSPNSNSRKKIARLAGLTAPLLRRKGSAIFSISSGLDAPGSGILVEEIPRRVFLVSRTLLPILSPVSERPGGVNRLFSPLLPTLGKDQGGKRKVKNRSKCSVGASMCHLEAPKLNLWDTPKPHIQP